MSLIYYITILYIHIIYNIVISMFLKSLLKKSFKEIFETSLTFCVLGGGRGPQRPGALFG